MNWPSRPLGELVEKGELSYGIVQPGGHVDSGVPIVRVKNLRNGRIDVEDLLRVSQSVSDRYARTVLRGGELLLSIVGTVGEAAVVPESLAGWNVARAIAVIRPAGVPAQWIRLALRTPTVRHAMNASLNTTVQATLNLADLRKLHIPMPPPSVQGAIIDVVGALDDKIAANDRAGKLALALADAEFMRAVSAVPVSAHTFGDLAEISGGGTPRTTIDAYWGGTVRWSTPTDVTALSLPYLSGTGRTITDEGLAACASKLYPEGSILMTSRATIGAFAIARRPVAVNQGFIVVNAKEPDLQLWLFHEMRSRIDEFISHANGATFLELSRGRFKQFPVRAPTSKQAAAFQEVAHPLHEVAAQTVAQIAVLTATRDELLPLLMSGKVRVLDAEKVGGEVV